jgi:hypothetical protein
MAGRAGAVIGEITGLHPAGHSEQFTLNALKKDPTFPAVQTFSTGSNPTWFLHGVSRYNGTDGFETFYTSPRCSERRFVFAQYDLLF